MDVDTDPVRRHWTRAAERWQGLPDTTEPWESLTVEPAGVGHREVDADGTPALWVEPEGTDDSAVMFYIHGGGGKEPVGSAIGCRSPGRDSFRGRPRSTRA